MSVSMKQSVIVNPLAALFVNPAICLNSYVVRMARGFLQGFLATCLACSVSVNAYGDDAFVKAAKSMSARAFDNNLPDESVERWLRAHIPVEYQVVWGEEVTDCGEGAGSAIDAERDMPLCAEVKVGPKMIGYQIKL
jgi:hypothetical protein